MPGLTQGDCSEVCYPPNLLIRTIKESRTTESSVTVMGETLQTKCYTVAQGRVSLSAIASSMLHQLLRNAPFIGSGEGTL